MTEMQAAIGRIQLKRMSDWTAIRNANARAIRESIFPFARDDGVVRLPHLRCDICPSSRSATECCDSCNGCQHAYYKFYFFVQTNNLAVGWSRNRIIEEFNARGVPCYVGSCSEVYLEKAFDNTGCRPKHRLPVAKELGETSLMILVHPTLTESEIRKTQEVIREVLTKASRLNERAASPPSN
jgi:dTDP-4-amino-4,6-dideoxygalactose transaminase